MTISKLRTGKVAAVQNFLCIVFVLIASAFAAGQAQADPISVSPEVLPPGKVGVAYDQTYVVSGGLSGGPYFSTFSGASDRIPGLCCFANNEFRISGVPKAAGTYVLRYLFGERAWLDEVPGASPPVPKIYTVVIAEPDPVEITLAGLPDGQAGQPYSAQLTASGGDGAYSFSIVSGAIPIGMSFSAAGAIGGTPIQSGSFTVRFRATDSGGRSGDRSYTFEIAPPPPVVVAPAILPDGQLGQPYNHTLTASGGVRGPYQFSIVSGNLPVGTFSSAGVMSGTALVAGIYNFRIRATDDVGYTGERDYTVVISDGPPVTIAPATLPDGKVGQFYDETLVASGGAGGPYSITLVGIPVMPPGLAYAGGRLSGTATVAGTYSFTVRAVDRAGNFTERDYSIVIADTPVTLSPTALPDGQVGQPYDQTVVASGGAGGPYSITLVGIPVTPPGLAYADGRFSGTATVAGTYPFTLRATDRGGNFIERQYSIVISSTPPVTLSPTTITAGQIGQPYSQTFTASGGIGAPYRYFVVVGNLPDGIDMALDGTLAGTPTQSGSFPFTVDVFDAADNRGSRQYTLVVDALPPPTAPSLTASVVAGETVTLPLTQGATGGPFSDAAILSSTPTEAGTATLSGAPAYALTFTSSSAFSGTAIVTYTLTGPGGVSAPATVTITVAPRPDPSDDPEVAGLLNAQAQAAQKFAAGRSTTSINAWALCAARPAATPLQTRFVCTAQARMAGREASYCLIKRGATTRP